MDDLDKLIIDKRAERDAYAEKVRLLDAQIAAFETAARLRPPPVANARSETGRRTSSARPSGGGRKPGDISHVWRGILQDTVSLGRRAAYEDILSIAENRGNALVLSSVRDRVRNLISTGLMEGDTSAGFLVTDEAIQRFGFSRPESDGDKASRDDAAETREARLSRILE